MPASQSFAEPVPRWPVGKEALLKALNEWVHAEADAILFAAPASGRSDAKQYVNMLRRWAGNIGAGRGWVIPRVGANLRAAARAVGPVAEERFDLAVALYRREVNKADKAVTSGKGTARDLRRARKDIETACAVRAPRVCWP